jgi:hypothetical protein
MSVGRFLLGKQVPVDRDQHVSRSGQMTVNPKVEVRSTSQNEPHNRASLMTIRCC